MTTKKKAAPKKKKAAPKEDYLTIKTQQYGFPSLVGNAYNNLINGMLNDRMPESLEGQVQYWKEKYERSEKQCDKYAAQVGVLERIIDGALRRSCNGND
jgi:hypothetical protein